MRYTDNPANYTYIPNHNPRAEPPAPTTEDLQRQLIRIETRLVKLMQHLGLDAYGDPLHADAYGDPI